MIAQFDVLTPLELKAELNSVYEWTLPTTGITIHSPIISPAFSTGANNECTWKFVYTKFLSLNHAVYLKLVASNDLVIEAECTFLVTSMNLSSKQQESFVQIFRKGYSVKLYESSATISSISCKITTKVAFPSAYQTLCREIRLGTFLNNVDIFEVLIANTEFADVKIITAEKKILPANKAVLTSRSSVFAAMFQHDMKEKKEAVVEMEDCKYEVVKEMLRYMYFRQANNLNSIVVDLTNLAHRYELKGLLASCAQHLYKTLSKTNYIETLLLADTLQMEELKELTVNFISKLQNDTQEQEAAKSREI